MRLHSRTFLAVSAAVAVSACSHIDQQPKLAPGQLDLLERYALTEQALDSLLNDLLADHPATDLNAPPSSARLWTADSRLGPWLLGGGLYENRSSIAAFKAVGVKQLDVVVAYPVLTGDEVRAEEFRVFYRELAELVRQQDIKLRVIVGPQYRGPMYLRGVPGRQPCDARASSTFAEHATRVAEILQPDVLALDINPDALRACGCDMLAEPAVAAALALSIVEEATVPANTRISIASSVRESDAFFEALLGSPLAFHLDFKVHVLGGKNSDVDRLRRLAELSRERGRDAAVGDYWLRKDVARAAQEIGESETYSIAHAARATMDVWGSVDRKMHAVMRQEASTLGLLYASAYQSDLLFTYLEADAAGLVEDEDPIGLVRRLRLEARSARIALLKARVAEQRGD